MGRLPREVEHTGSDEGRKKRVPLGVPRMKLNTKPIPGYVTRWVCDRPGRLQAAQEGGYEFVREEMEVGQDSATRATSTDSRISRVVGTHKDESTMKAYLMKIKKEWYDEDQEAKAKRIADGEKAIFRGKERNMAADQHGMYDPGGSEITSNTYQKRPADT